jgi:hypothetical protein
MTVAETKTQPEHADIDGMLKQARELLQDGRIEASRAAARRSHRGFGRPGAETAARKPGQR